MCVGVRMCCEYQLHRVEPRRVGQKPIPVRIHQTHTNQHPHDHTDTLRFFLSIQPVINSMSGGEEERLTKYLAMEPPW